MKSKRQTRQILLPGFNHRLKDRLHGGELSKNKRKTQRPFDPKQGLHVVLKSSLASGSLSLLSPKYCHQIHGMVLRMKERWGISVYQYANVGNHLHLLIRARSRAQWQGFIRELSGGIAMLVTGVKKGIPLWRLGAKSRFWDHLVFTRIVSFGRDFKRVTHYVTKNMWEGLGVPVRNLGDDDLIPL